MSNKAKELRGQMRQVVKELYPELVTHELYGKLQGVIIDKLKELDAEIKSTLLRIDTRAKEVQDFVMRQVAQDLASRQSDQKQQDIVTQTDE